MSKQKKQIMDGVVASSADGLSLQLLKAKCSKDQLREIVKDITDELGGYNLATVEGAAAKQGLKIQFSIPVILRGRDATLFINTLINNLANGKLSEHSIYNKP